MFQHASHHPYPAMKRLGVGTDNKNNSFFCEPAPRHVEKANRMLNMLKDVHKHNAVKFLLGLEFFKERAYEIGVAKAKPFCVGNELLRTVYSGDMLEML